MNLEELSSKYKLINLFVQLAEIPSPSRKEEKVAERIYEILCIHNIQAQFDEYGNIIAKVPASVNCKNVPPILLSAHMDVVGGSEPVNIRLSRDGRYIETDKTRTLGSDDKAGLAAILDLAIDLNSLASTVEHGPIEITFTRDEEMGMTGVKNLDTSKLKSKYAVIADGEYVGELDIEGAGFTNVYIKVSGGKGGHSGINIGDETRVSAIKVLSELDSQIPQGVYKKDEKGIITSINAAQVAGGSINTLLAESIKDVYKLAKENKPIPDKYTAKNILETINKESMLNVIASEAEQSYSIRSSDPENELELINLIKDKVKTLNKKYAGLINIDIEIKSHLKPFVRSKDTILTDTIIKAGEKTGLKVKPVSFHAGAETHIFANNKKNASGESFVPVIIGVANLENIHSSDEKLDWNSLLTGRKWLEDIVVMFAQEHKN